MMKRMIGLCVSGIIVALIWNRIAFDSILFAVRQTQTPLLIAGVLLVIPLTLATAWRFQRLSRSDLSLGTAIRLTLSASTLNLVLPSKMGDIAKSWALTSRHGYDGSLALAIVILEKMLDLASLLFCGVLALFWIGIDNHWYWLPAIGIFGLLSILVFILSPLTVVPAVLRWTASHMPGKVGRALASFSSQWSLVIVWFWDKPGRAAGMCLASVVLWAGHLAQFWLFALALGALVPFVDNMAFATLSILVGLAPFTMAGIGTRDAAILFFYGSWLTPGQGALLGVLATMRYLIPAIAGLPFLGDYMPRQFKPQP